MADKVRIGLVGCGGIANGKHMPSLSRLKNVELVAFSDIVEERMLKAAKEFGSADAKTYADYRKMLEDKTIDVVHVLTPNDSHADDCDCGDGSGQTRHERETDGENRRRRETQW